MTEEFLKDEELPTGHNELAVIEIVGDWKDVFEDEVRVVAGLAQLHEEVVEGEHGLLADASFLSLYHPPKDDV